MFPALHIKQIVFLLLVVVVFLMPSAASALGNQPVISQAKTGESGFASNEFLTIYNNSESPVDVTDWCVVYSSSSDATKSNLSCLSKPSANVKLMLAPFSYAQFSSEEFKNTVLNFIPDGLFTAGMSGTSGHIRLLDAQKKEIDKLGWGAAVSPEGTAVPTHSSGFILQRKTGATANFLKDTDNNSDDFYQILLSTVPPSGVYEEVVPIDVCANIDGLQTTMPDDYFTNAEGGCSQDQCDNVDGLQVVVPAGYRSSDGINCEVLESAALQITELLPNASGTDTGNEYIEIYNPNDKAVNMNGYSLQIGPSFSKSFVFGEQIVEPFTYNSYGDSITGLVLPNSSANIRLVAPSGNVVSETSTYNEPQDDTAWALIDFVWQYTNRPTESQANLPSLELPTLLSSAGLEPCEAGKYRNPETNRCKSIEVGDTELKPCDIGQVRNLETNRCRGAGASADGLVPCKEGQERNPETNRCRNLVSTASSLAPCAPGQERNIETNRCRKSTVLGDSLAKVQDVPAESNNNFNWLILAPLFVAVAGYGVYEWRHELARQFMRLRSRF